MVVGTAKTSCASRCSRRSVQGALRAPAEGEGGEGWSRHHHARAFGERLCAAVACAVRVGAERRWDRSAFPPGQADPSVDLSPQVDIFSGLLGWEEREADSVLADGVFTALAVTTRPLNSHRRRLQLQCRYTRATAESASPAKQDCVALLPSSALLARPRREFCDPTTTPTDLPSCAIL